MTKGLFKKNINRSIGGNLLVFLVVLLLACFMLLPIVYAVSSAFKPLDEIFIFPPRMFVRKPTLDNFVQLAQITRQTPYNVVGYLELFHFFHQVPFLSS